MGVPNSDLIRTIFAHCAWKYKSKEAIKTLSFYMSVCDQRVAKFYSINAIFPEKFKTEGRC